MDSIINFNEFLPEKPLELAREAGSEADLCLVLGSSLTVPPACLIPAEVGENKEAKLVIVNLQPTDYDHLASLRIWGRCDDVMKLVMDRLELTPPEFVLNRRLAVEITENPPTSARFDIRVKGIDVDGTPSTFLRSVKLENNRRLVKAEPFAIHMRSGLEKGVSLRFEFEFMGNYGEPNLKIEVPYNGGAEEKVIYGLRYHPNAGEWVIGEEVEELTKEISVVDLTGDD